MGDRRFVRVFLWRDRAVGDLGGGRVCLDPDPRIGACAGDAALWNFVEHHPAFFRRVDRARSHALGEWFRQCCAYANQEIFFISLAGPFSGFLLAAFAIVGALVVGGSVTMGTLLLIFTVPVNVVLPFGVAVLNSFVLNLLWVNIFWGIFNLVPVYPLDGGHVTRYVLLKADPLNGVRKSLWVSVIAGISFALIGFFLLGSTYMAILFAYLAFQSYQALQGSVGGY